jgi:ceramide glucosyltransferase
MLEILLLLFTVASWIYWLVAWWLVRVFFRVRPEQNPDFTPPVSILKPVRGLDAQAYQNFVSFCQQDYPDFELLFGVADPGDPVIPVVQRLQRDFPRCRIRLVIGQASGANPKASLLHHITAQARHGVLVISDSDMRVTPDYLRRVVAPLADEHIGLITCPYRGEAPLTFTARLEALYMGITFLPSVIVAREFLGMRFAMGSTVALRRSDLARIGGFAAIADYLADDYQLAVRIADLGLRVHLSDYVVASVLGATTFREQWDREVRWAQCTRVSRPWEYPGLLLTFSTPLALVLAVVTRFSPLGWLSLAISLLLRWLLAWPITAYTANQAARQWLVWLPVRDMLTPLVWCAGALGRRVVWRGEEFVLRADGRLELPPLRQRSIGEQYPALLERGIRSLDVLLRRVHHVYEFSNDEECLLRLAISVSDRDLTLSDGTRVRQGERIGEIHLWNEHIPLMPKDGPDLAWGLTFQRRARRSLRELAAYIQSEPQFQGIQAFRGETSFASRDLMELMAGMAERWGFEVVNPDHSDGFWQRFADFWRNVYVVGLIWAFNPGSLKSKNLWGLKRGQLWISRGVLINNYGAKKKSHDLAEGDVDRERLFAGVEEQTRVV